MAEVEADLRERGEPPARPGVLARLRERFAVDGRRRSPACARRVAVGGAVVRAARRRSSPATRSPRSRRTTDARTRRGQRRRADHARRERQPAGARRRWSEGAILRVHGMPTLDSDVRLPGVGPARRRGDLAVAVQRGRGRRRRRGGLRGPRGRRRGDGHARARRRRPGAERATRSSPSRCRRPSLVSGSRWRPVTATPTARPGVSCSNCGRPICPDCMTSTSVGMRCPECARQKTKVKTMGSVTEPTLTYVLIGINVAVALGTFLSGASATGGGGARLVAARRRLGVALRRRAGRVLAHRHRRASCTRG